jgi:hypothetical protein
VNDHEFSQKPSGSAAVLLRPATRRTFPPPFTDQQAPYKQQHTAAELYRRLRDEHGYPGGYDQVRRHVGKVCRAQRETFIPLTHPPGRRLEADFGHIYVDFPEGRQQVSVLLLT